MGGCNPTCNGNNTGWNCTGNPTICNPICGDSIKVGSETCDDGGIGCNSNCIGSLPTYICSGTPTVCVPKCGDGKVVGTETCDDGLANGNGCNPGCTSVAAGWTCTPGSPTTASVCTQSSLTCSNGVLNAGETCDDQNVLNGDGCSSTC